jgi:hypothetical protein
VAVCCTHPRPRQRGFESALVTLAPIGRDAGEARQCGERKALTHAPMSSISTLIALSARHGPASVNILNPNTDATWEVHPNLHCSNFLLVPIRCLLAAFMLEYCQLQPEEIAGDLGIPPGRAEHQSSPRPLARTSHTLILILTTLDACRLLDQSLVDRGL